MTSPAHDLLAQLRRELHPALAGLFFAALTLVFGFGIGIVFGVAEDKMKGGLAASAAAVRSTVYKDNDAAIKANLDKAWSYVKRAHLHAGVLGGTDGALILVTAVLGAPAGLSRAISLGLGLGGLGYSVYWLLAAYRVPGMGSSTAAKESLSWLAMPSSGVIVLATLAVTALIAARLRSRPAS